MSGLRSNSSQGHARNKSATKSRPRSSTKGPLDAEDDPLTSSQLTPATQVPHRTAQSPRSPPNRSSTGTPVTQLGESRSHDFSFLLRPEIYHPLTALNVPIAFRDSSNQPNLEAPLEELLSKGHFRAAAIAAVQELTGRVDPKDAKTIFNLLYTRLACLTLIDSTSLAAQEAKPLNDLGSHVYVDDITGENLAPWELRVLLVRLQALGFADSRRAVVSYHELAREARERISKAASNHDNSARELWKARLQELGIKVTGALIEMDDVSGAAAHLSSLPDWGDSKMALTKALMWLHLGDVQSARACAIKCSQDAETTEQIILALADAADGDYEAALEKWLRLRDGLEDEMVGVNAAVCSMYLGRLEECRKILEELVDSALTSHTLLFNLSTIYELCSEKNRDLKMKLADRVAALGLGEKFNADFKL